jgi:hypothetical protein
LGVKHKFPLGKIHFKSSTKSTSFVDFRMSIHVFVVNAVNHPSDSLRAAGLHALCGSLQVDFRDIGCSDVDLDDDWFREVFDRDFHVITDSAL